MSSPVNVLPSSFRDPSGFVYRKNGILYRQVNRSFQPDYDLFISSGLYKVLTDGKLLVAHRETDVDPVDPVNAYKILEPETLPFISYPYEWSFGMIKDAALLTLRLARESMKRGMMLRDATPYNIQFRDNRPVFIDTLSFGIYDEQVPWVAYRQFCETMLAPLLLAHYLGQPMHPLMLAYPEGIPLKLVAAALPRSTKWSLHSYLHIHLHAKTGSDYEGKKRRPFNAKKLGNILSSLEILVKNASRLLLERTGRLIMMKPGKETATYRPKQSSSGSGFRGCHFVPPLIWEPIPAGLQKCWPKNAGIAWRSTAMPNALTGFTPVKRSGLSPWWPIFPILPRGSD